MSICGKLSGMTKIILQTVTGSHAYGLNHADSDTDRMSIFVAPTVDVAGLDWNSNKESWSDAGPTGDDNTGHEIGKYLRLVLKSNPTLIELLFMNDYEILTDEAQGLLDIRDAFLYTDGIRNAYYGYAAAQYSRVLREYPDHKQKMSRHCLRITNQAIELLTTGKCNPLVSNREELFSLDGMNYSELSLVMGTAVAMINTSESVLPDKPDRDTVRDFLKEVRKNN